MQDHSNAPKYDSSFHFSYRSNAYHQHMFNMCVFENAQESFKMSLLVDSTAAGLGAATATGHSLVKVQAEELIQLRAHGRTEYDELAFRGLVQGATLKLDVTSERKILFEVQLTAINENAPIEFYVLSLEYGAETWREDFCLETTIAAIEPRNTGDEAKSTMSSASSATSSTKKQVFTVPSGYKRHYIDVCQSHDWSTGFMIRAEYYANGSDAKTHRLHLTGPLNIKVCVRPTARVGALRLQLLKTFNDANCPDNVQFHCVGGQVYASRLVLAAQSPVFESMFYGKHKMQESQSLSVKLEDFDVEAVHEFLYACYAGHVHFDKPVTLWARVFALADKYLCRSVQDAVLDRLELLRNEALPDVLKEAMQYKCKELCEYVLGKCGLHPAVLASVASAILS